jgi:putative Mg2+ transporter-C (MgtC) family protein
MASLEAWLGNLHAVEGLSPAAAGLACIVASAICGLTIGIERERREKPAGLRTVVLIALGTTIYTLMSLQLASTKPMADPARLASQVLPGIGFLGGGAILRAGGQVRGLTTAATIWAVAAVGVAVGAGYVAAGAGLTVLILLTLTLAHRLEDFVTGGCGYREARIAFDPDSGKTLPRLQQILDRFDVPDDRVAIDETDPGRPVLRARVCTSHREHRGILHDLAETPQVRAIELVE